MIATNKHEYCLYLLKEGQIDSCEKHDGGIELKGTFIYMTDYSQDEVMSDCIEHCIKTLECVAISFYAKPNCYFHTNSTFIASDISGWQSIIFLEKIRKDVKFIDTAVVGISRGFENDNDKHANLDECKKLCEKDKYCVAYSHCDCPTETDQCQRFRKEEIQGLRKDTGKTTVFISRPSNI